MSFTGKIAYKLLPKRLFNSLWVFKNPDRVFTGEGIIYNQDGLATNHNFDFINDEKFARAYKKGADTGSWWESKIHWRAFVICWAADKAKNLEGDFVECGVNRGGYSRMVIEYIDFSSSKNKKFYLLDTYEGLSDKYISEEEKKLGRKAGKAGGYEECYEDVKKTFDKFENVIIIKGTVPDTLPEVKSEKLCYLSIDMNCAEPEIAAAEFFWDKLVSGAVMVLDDYGWPGHIVQKHAFDEFAKIKNVPILSLPTGQGIILKP